MLNSNNRINIHNIYFGSSIKLMDNVLIKENNNILTVYYSESNGSWLFCRLSYFRSLYKADLSNKNRVYETQIYLLQYVGPNRILSGTDLISKNR